MKNFLILIWVNFNSSPPITIFNLPSKSMKISMHPNFVQKISVNGGTLIDFLIVFLEINEGKLKIPGGRLKLNIKLNQTVK